MINSKIHPCYNTISMNAKRLSPLQNQVAQFQELPSLFLQGPAGTGKTTAGVARLAALLDSGVPGGSILVFVPQRTLATPYTDFLQSSSSPAGGMVNILTLGGLARRLINLFWPLVARPAGFLNPTRPPHFLTSETAQYYMSHLVRPLLDEGLFHSVTIQRSRLYSQILDNLNKSAIIGIPYTEIGDRLASAWVGEPGQTRVYNDVQYCVNQFRQFCLEHNLLDYSLQIEIFKQHLWSSWLCQQYVKANFHHFIFDNVEEDTPIAHDLIQDWLPEFETSLLIFDQDAGYRRFLGSDPLSALSLLNLCQSHITFNTNYTCLPPLRKIASEIGYLLEQPVREASEIDLIENLNISASILPDIPPVNFPPRILRFYPQLLDWITNEISSLVASGVSPGEIAILTPYLSDALRFSITNRLSQANISYRTHRPSRSLRDEPATHCLLTLAQLAHPAWELHPTKFDVAYALLQAIEGLDPVRAQILVEIVYRQKDGIPHLNSFSQITPDTQARITYSLGNRYESLRQWLESAMQDQELELDFFLSRLFGEVLSQPGYGFHASLDAGRVAANLIESIQKFRWAIEENLETVPFSLGKEYILMVREGVIAAQYVSNWQTQAQNSVYIAPAYTFLMNNQAVDYQFWVDIGNPGWSERLNQPLTHPYVLSREWNRGRVWTNADEYEATLDSMYRLVSGLTRRCRKSLFLGFCELNEQGFENRGMLLKTIQRALQMSHRSKDG